MRPLADFIIHVTRVGIRSALAEAKGSAADFYGGKKPERVDWVLQYPDIEMIVEMLDEDERRRHRGVP